MATAIQSALVGQKKPKEALDEAQARIEQIMRAERAEAGRWRRQALRPATALVAICGRVLAQRERRFALALLAPALVVLLLTTTAPLVYLVWTSLHRIDLAMPWLVGLRRPRQLREDGQRPALLEFARC